MSGILNIGTKNRETAQIRLTVFLFSYNFSLPPASAYHAHGAELEIRALRPRA